MKSPEELRKLQIPKWSYCRITGTPVTEDQALEIIRRIDDYFDKYGHCIEDPNEQLVVADLVSLPLDSCMSTEKHEEYVNKYEEWNKKWKHIHLEYLYTEWFTTYFALGHSGWIHPNGEIEYHYNVGKYATVEEIESELKTIMKNFPYLELECTLHDDEYCVKNKPVVSFLCRKGEVTLVDPKKRDIHKEFNRYDYVYSEEMLQEDIKRFRDILDGNDDATTSPISTDTIVKWRDIIK